MIAARKGRDWARRYPPLTVVVVALTLAVFALPSALNLPQANPSQTLEYAPVPGDQGNTSSGANFAGLGLGQGGTSAGSVGAGPGSNDGGQPPPQQPQSSLTQPPSQYQCVGNPPRQTEDPLSPPCVGFYKGNNGGSTAVGVTGTEIKVLFRFVELQGNCRSGVSGGNSCPPPSGIYDMDKPSDYNQYFEWVDVHNWQTYFNQRYQTYNRRVHFYIQNYGDTNDYVQSGFTADKASAQAAEAWKQVQPFAIEDRTTLFSENYSAYFAQKHSEIFGYLTQKLASQYPGQYWSYSPSLEYAAKQYADFVCTRVVKPGKVSFSGNNDHGSNRVYGVLLTDDNQNIQTGQVQRLAVQAMRDQCGFNPADTEYFHYSDAFSASGPRSGWGPANMARMRAAHVTTVIWPGGEESEDMQAADKLQWYPEWMLLGDGLLDGNLMSAQPTKEIANAWVASPVTLENANGIPVEPPCLDALNQVNPGISHQGSDVVYACGGVYSHLYDDIRQIFTGIQLAGPHLTAQSMDQGFHAIPPTPSPGPTQPSCFYPEGDYTCVKDAVAEWFDTTTPQPASDSTGCWRMWRGGVRYLPGRWPQGDLNEKSPSDICNLLAGGLQNTIRPT